MLFPLYEFAYVLEDFHTLSSRVQASKIQRLDEFVVKRVTDVFVLLLTVQDQLSACWPARRRCVPVSRPRLRRPSLIIKRLRVTTPSAYSITSPVSLYITCDLACPGRSCGSGRRTTSPWGWSRIDRANLIPKRRRCRGDSRRWKDSPRERRGRRWRPRPFRLPLLKSLEGIME